MFFKVTLPQILLNHLLQHDVARLDFIVHLARFFTHFQIFPNLHDLHTRLSSRLICYQYEQVLWLTVLEEVNKYDFLVKTVAYLTP